MGFAGSSEFFSVLSRICASKIRLSVDNVINWIRLPLSFPLPLCGAGVELLTEGEMTKGQQSGGEQGMALSRKTSSSPSLAFS